MISQESVKAKPGPWGCVQACEKWSEDEEIHLCPGHHWLFEFGEAPDGSRCEFTFSFLPLQPKRNGVVYKARARAFTMEIELSWSRDGFTAWLRMPRVLHLRSGTPPRMLTTHSLLCQ